MSKAKKFIQFNSRVGMDYLDSINSLRAEEPALVIKTTVTLAGEIPDDLVLRWSNEAAEHEALITIKLEGTSGQKSHEFSHRLYTPQLPLAMQEFDEANNNGHQTPEDLEPTEEQAAADLEEAAQAAAQEANKPIRQGRAGRNSNPAPTA